MNLSTSDRMILRNVLESMMNGQAYKPKSEGELKRCMEMEEEEDWLAGVDFNESQKDPRPNSSPGCYVSFVLYRKIVDILGEGII